jgi:alkanesulfonate monooxygenase SsuD/methylene tetrahydromethanopterin reductase-like flavin-dependent oxidoreductase (luciferase family)
MKVLVRRPKYRGLIGSDGSPMLEIGIRLGHLQGHWNAIRSLALRADEAGFDSIWISDHLATAPDKPQPVLEGWTLLSALGALTSTAQLGAVLCQGFRSPALLAKMTTTLDLMTSGRLRMVLAAGYDEYEHRSFGFTFLDADNRIRLLEESIIVLRGLWDSKGAPFSFTGQHVSVDQAVNNPPPQRRIEFAVGAVGPRMLDLAARYADEWSCPAHVMSDYRELSSRMYEAEAKHNRTVRRMVSVSFRPNTPGNTFPMSEVGGSLAQMVDRLGALVDLGVGTINGSVEDLGTLERIAEVLPELRRAC